ncbi:hypothetical protein HAX54_027597, partial [Datura stramonium]|nr:hypothetical protein [Datura stramonium]
MLDALKERGKAKGEVEDFEKYFPLPVPQFPPRISQQALDAKVAKHIECIKEATLQVLFIDAIKEKPEFAKYLKMFLTRKLFYDKEEVIPVIHRVSAIIVGTCVEKKGDVGEFT